ncbi:MAG: SGNH/GDSL hydrolase family protein [Planctomycetes bacterium]|nr:SGNH/GDSL hydrolase family protein [Planctomycetota bacterium]
MLRSLPIVIAILILWFGAQISAQEAARPKWKYDPTLTRPFWEGEIVAGESVLFIKDEKSGEARASVLFPVLEIVSVKNSAGDLTYENGRDYIWKSGMREIVLPTGSRIVSRTPAELRRPANSQKYQLTHRDGNGEIFFGGRLEYADMQTCITYRHAPDAWKFPIPKFSATALPKSIAKLSQKQPFKIVVLGDSISAGANASLLGDGPPYQPAYPELFQQTLAARYSTPVDLKNLSVGGTSTDWGLKQIDAVIAEKPDLVVLAFGMNDSAGRPGGEYGKNTAGMIAGIREKLPESEFILVASMLGNRDWIRLRQESFSEFREELMKLCQPGIALADLTAIWTGFLELKQDWDQTGNGVNHPNDFGHRVYTQVLATLLTPPSLLETGRGKAKPGTSD